MDRRVTRLRQMGVDSEAAQALVDAGLDTPRKIKAAKAKAVKDAKADKDAKVKAWRS